MNKLFTRTYKIGTFKNGRPCLFSIISQIKVEAKAKTEVEVKNESAKQFNEGKVRMEISSPKFIYNVHEV